MRRGYRRTGGRATVVVVTLALGACSSSGSRAASTHRTRPTPPPRTITLVDTTRIDPIFQQGIARDGGGWVLSGTNVIARMNASDTAVEAKITPVIPPELAAKGYDHVGDVDVVGTTLYVPFEQPDYDADHQVMARFDAVTLRLIDTTVVRQHHNSFVAVDPTRGIAYSTDWFDDQALLRYDVRHHWKPLRPLRLDRKLMHIQGGAVGGGAFWISTDDDHNGVYRVDLSSGAVTDLGSTGHGAGEVEGIAFAPVHGAMLHTLTVDEKITPVYIDHWKPTR
ncbi:MAG: hypothetical protein ACXVJ7_12885 [Acidimicrobiia bacterium]